MCACVPTIWHPRGRMVLIMIMNKIMAIVMLLLSSHSSPRPPPLTSSLTHHLIRPLIHLIRPLTHPLSPHSPPLPSSLAHLSPPPSPTTSSTHSSPPSSLTHSPPLPSSLLLQDSDCWKTGAPTPADPTYKPPVTRYVPVHSFSVYTVRNST